MTASEGHESALEGVPPEIWVRIFAMLVAPMHPFLIQVDAGKLASLPWSDLVHLTGVSRYWREIALSKKDWWTCLPTHNIPAMDLYMTRAGDSPLYVVLNTGSMERPIPLTAQKQRELLSKDVLPRIKALYWTFTSPSTSHWYPIAPEPGLAPSALTPVQVQKLLLRSPAPLLEDLYLEGEAFGERISFNNSALHAQVFQHHVPRLRTLRLTRRLVHCSNPVFSRNLRILCLKEVADVWWTIDHMLDTLESMPMLEKIVLTYKTSPHAGSLVSKVSQPTIERMIDLPHLTSFFWNDMLLPMVCALSYISTSEWAILDLHAKGISLGRARLKRSQLDALILNLNAHYDRATDTGLFYRVAQVALRENQLDSFTIYAGSLARDYTLPATPDDAFDDLYRTLKAGPFTLRLVIEWDACPEEGDADDISTAERVLNEVHVLKHLRVLRVGTRTDPLKPSLRDYPKLSSNWRVLFAAQREVCWLELTHHPVRAFINSQRDEPREGREDVFPLLSRLWLENVALMDVRKGSIVVPSVETWVLTTVLRRRRPNLEKVLVYDCHLQGEDARVQRVKAQLENAIGPDRWRWDGQRSKWIDDEYELVEVALGEGEQEDNDVEDGEGDGDIDEGDGLGMDGDEQDDEGEDEDDGDPDEEQWEDEGEIDWNAESESD
ncbi:hypothetical protein PENSPDRAFT_663366 [Peniophora sp. CONT]|nr:hypothetical protein PENSPDRAFT_663366 [Peniophora sp. CONT]